MVEAKAGGWRGAPPPKVKCEKCGKIFQRSRSLLARAKHIACSNECSYALRSEYHPLKGKKTFYKVKKVKIKTPKIIKNNKSPINNTGISTKILKKSLKKSNNIYDHDKTFQILAIHFLGYSVKKLLKLKFL